MVDIFMWARSSMDRMPGFGPVDRGSNPRVPIYFLSFFQERYLNQFLYIN